MAFPQGSAIQSPLTMLFALEITVSRRRIRARQAQRPQWNPEDDTSVTPSEPNSRASSPARRGGLPRKVEALVCNLENELREAAAAENNRRRAAEMEYKVQQLAADIEREQESSERTIHIERNTVMCFIQKLNEVAEDMYYLYRTLPVVTEQREFTTAREQELKTEQLIIAYLVRGEVRETVFKLRTIKRCTSKCTNTAEMGMNKHCNAKCIQEVDSPLPKYQDFAGKVITIAFVPTLGTRWSKNLDATPAVSRGYATWEYHISIIRQSSR